MASIIMLDINLIVTCMDYVQSIGKYMPNLLILCIPKCDKILSSYKIFWIHTNCFWSFLFLIQNSSLIIISSPHFIFTIVTYGNNFLYIINWKLAMVLLRFSFSYLPPRCPFLIAVIWWFYAVYALPLHICP